jgi:hypothetical protein
MPPFLIAFIIMCVIVSGALGVWLYRLDTDD